MLSKINSMLSSSDPSNIKLGVTLLESLYPTEYAALAAEWQPWADIFGTNVADTTARNGLGEIDCSGMELRKIPALPKTVQVLICSDNELTELPALPNIRVLYCSNNELTELPALPNVRELYCRNNELTELPALPNVQVLHCWSNQLTSLPALPNVRELYCRNNRFSNSAAILELYPFAQM